MEHDGLLIRRLRWHEGNAENCWHHGVSIGEIENALISTARVIMPDAKRSTDEARYLAIGPTVSGGDLFVVLIFRTVAGRKLMRPITARYMHRKEAERYGQTHTTI